MKTKILIIVLLLLFPFGIGVFAQAAELPDSGLPAEGLPKAGLTPDSPFYFFDTLAEKISLLFTFDIVKKAEKAFQYAGEKIAEVKIMAGANKIEALKKAGQKYQEYLSLFFKKGGKASEEGKDVKELERISKSKSLDYLRVLADTQEESSAEAKTEVEKIIKVSRESFGETIWSVHEEQMKELREEKIREELKKETEKIGNEFDQIGSAYLSDFIDILHDELVAPVFGNKKIPREDFNYKEAIISKTLTKDGIKEIRYSLTRIAKLRDQAKDIQNKTRELFL